MTIEIRIDDADIERALKKLADAGDMAPALKEIGEHLVESTKERFGDQTAPDGKKWAANKPSTLARKGNRPPLTGETGLLADTINYQLDGDTLLVGSPMEYAAMQQFGGEKTEFPNLWGDIPARPFLGLSDADRDEIQTIIRDHYEKTLK